jgi:hypothetical protein
VSRYRERLSRLAQSFGLTCRLHEETLTCPTCQPQAPYPEFLATAIHAFINHIVDRIGHEALRAAALMVPRLPVQELCGRCGTRQTCMRCQVRYGHALLAAIGLTDDERALLDSMLDTCRQIDADP